MAQRTFRLAENIRRYRTFAVDLTPEEEKEVDALIERDDADGLVSFVDRHDDDPLYVQDDFDDQLEEPQRDANLLDILDADDKCLWEG